ncbi:MAG TPA: AzlD domain-containing protein [Rhizobiales bacterium]|nr:AzlD domain-containing protein [Hyphomicrobiales bacterium]
MSNNLTIYLLILAAGTLPNYIWRFFGVIFAARLDEDSPVLRWVNAVATALIAALVARILISPAGALADTELTSRLLGMVAGVITFGLSRRNLGLAMIAAVTSFLLAQALMQLPAP